MLLTKVAGLPIVKAVSRNFGLWAIASDNAGNRDLGWHGSGFVQRIIERNVRDELREGSEVAVMPEPKPTDGDY